METDAVIVKIDPAEYGLNETKAKEVEAMFQPMLDRMVELESEYNEISSLKVSNETCILARDLRLKYVKVRRGTSDIHKELKAFYLNGGRFVDGWKNAQIFACQGIEESLLSIENHYQILEKKRIAKLQEKRAAEMGKYDISYIPENLGEMSDDVWQNLITGTRVNYEARIEAEQKAETEKIEAKQKEEAEKIKREKAEFKEREKIRIENERLKKEAEQREKQDKIDEEKRAKIEAKRKEKEQADRKIYEAKLKKEREEREKFEAELLEKARAEKERQIEADEKAQLEQQEREYAERQAKLAPDKEKLEVLTEDIRLIVFPNVDSQEATDLLHNVKYQLIQVIELLEAFEA